MGFALRFERRPAHSREKVWRALTGRDELRTWFVQILDYDRSRLEFTEGAERAGSSGSSGRACWSTPGTVRSCASS
ncbi:hypothetical protein YIM_18915 [Amycolatopsis sp. YIM 10]|nr:hypothetical protein YIM_18915 [Amycolatopsis sp. YIM 10]